MKKERCFTMRRKETQLLVENWRNLLNSNNYDCGVDFLESCNFNSDRIDEGLGFNTETLLAAIAAIGATFGGSIDNVQARPSIYDDAQSAFEELDDSIEQENMRKQEAEKEYLESMLKVLSDNGVPSSITDKLRSMYENGNGEKKAAVILYTQSKVEAFDARIAKLPAKDPTVKKYKEFQVKQQAAKDLKDGPGKDDKGEYIVKKGKKYYLVSKKIIQTTFRNQKMIDKINSAKRGRR